MLLSVNVEGLVFEPGSNCVTIQNSGSSLSRFDIVFVGHAYPNASLAQFASEVNLHQTTLLSVPPISTNAGNINVHYVNESANLGCYYGCNGIPRLICCTNGAVVKLAAQCPVDDIVMEGNLAKIIYANCDNCGLCIKKCPVKVIKTRPEPPNLL